MVEMPASPAPQSVTIRASRTGLVRDVAIAPDDVRFEARRADNVLRRPAFEALSPAARDAFLRRGGRVVA